MNQNPELTVSQKASFDFIRYATVWEDPKVLIEALKIKKNERVLSIASAGDNCFSLLMGDPAYVVAADISPVQLYLTELKIKAIQTLPYEDVLAFLGYKHSENRTQLFEKIAPFLSKEAEAYFRNTLSRWVSTGIIHQGKFEKYFQIFSSKVLPLIHRKWKIEKLLSPKTDLEQRQFFLQHWNTRRWRWLFKLFFSRTVMGWLGRDPEFLKQVEIPVSDFILNQAEKHLSSSQATQNPFLRYNLTGSFGDLLPHYLQPQNYEFIKTRIHRISLFHGFAEDAITQYGPFHAMNLSNIFEYMNVHEFEQTAQKLVYGLLPGGRMAYWNLMVKRRCSEVATHLIEQTNLMSELRPKDHGYFYSGIVSDVLHEPFDFGVWPLNPDTLAVGYPESSNEITFTNQIDILKKWASASGYKKLVGPMNSSTWEQYRFKTSSHRNFLGDLPYQQESIELYNNAGFQPSERYVSTLMHEIPNSISRLDARKTSLENLGLTFRALNPEKWEDELKNIHELSLESFAGNPYYTPINWNDFLLKYNESRSFIDPQWVLLAELEQNLQGFVFSYIDMDNKSIIMKTVARKPDFRLGGLGLVMTEILQQKAKNNGIHHVIHSFMHQDAASLRCSESLRAEIISEYHLYEIKL